MSEPEALRILEVGGFRIEKGQILPPRGKEAEDVTVAQSNAINALCTEYDYTYPA